MGIPDEAAELCVRYLAAIDKAAAGLLDGLYLVGSVALDDYWPGRSDIDFVAVTSRPVRAEEVMPVHAALASRPWFDGIYVTRDELRRPAHEAKPGLAIIDGKARPQTRAERHAVTWLTLAQHGLAIRGAAPSALVSPPISRRRDSTQGITSRATGRRGVPNASTY